MEVPIPVAVRSKEWFCSCSLPGFAGSNPDGGMDVSVVNVVCFQVEVSMTGPITRPEESYRV